MRYEKYINLLGQTNEVGQRTPGICYGSVVKAREAAGWRPCGSLNPAMASGAALGNALFN